VEPEVRGRQEKCVQREKRYPFGHADPPPDRGTVYSRKRGGRCWPRSLVT
jgi:hypothetical protein